MLILLFSYPVFAADVLLVDDDDNAPSTPRTFYTAALEALGVDYEVWDTANSDNEPDAS